MSQLLSIINWNEVRDPQRLGLRNYDSLIEHSARVCELYNKRLERLDFLYSWQYRPDCPKIITKSSSIRNYLHRSEWAKIDRYQKEARRSIWQKCVEVGNPEYKCRKNISEISLHALKFANVPDKSRETLYWRLNRSNSSDGWVVEDNLPLRG